jgi:hypothetical protein
MVRWRRFKLKPSSSRRAMIASRTRLVDSARGSMPSTCERNGLQQSQAARDSSIVTSTTRLCP